MIIEIKYDENGRPNTPAKNDDQGSAYLGWTGMSSNSEPVTSRPNNDRRKRKDGAVVEIDTVFGHMLGLVDGQQVCFPT